MPSFIDQILFRIGGNRLRIVLARKWGVKIGKNCVINPPCTFRKPYLVSIGDDCVITSGVSFLTSDGAIRIFKKSGDFKETVYGPIIIRDNCFIGLNSIILLNVVVGPNSIIGAGSVVTKDIPPNTVYAGNPAKFICTYDEYLKKSKLRSTGEIALKKRKKKLKEMFKNVLNG